IIFILMFLSLFIFKGKDSFAQNKYEKAGIDSVAFQKRYFAEQNLKDSLLKLANQKRIADSTERALAKQKIQDYRDSLIKARIEKKRADSTAKELAKLKILEEKRVQDSLVQAERNRLYNIAQEKQRILDSIKLVQDNYRDSLIAARKMAASERETLQKYKNSKAYKDSVAIAKKTIAEEKKLASLERQKLIAAQRDKTKDSLAAIRQAELAKTNAANQEIIAAQKAEKEKEQEKLKVEREKAKEELAKNKEERLKKTKAETKEKTKEKVAVKTKTDAQKEKEKLMASHSKKEKEWTNDKLLKKSWNLKRRIFQNTVTRYNGFYNAKRKYDLALSNISKSHKDQYLQPIGINSFDIKASTSGLSSEMDSVIKKCAYDAHIHDPRSKWFDNLYLLMGKAFFHKGDYEGAITAFQFVANEYKNQQKTAKGKKTSTNKSGIATVENRKGRHALEHHPVRNDALLWLVKAYIYDEKYGDAFSLIQVLEKDKAFPKRLRGDLYLVSSELELEQQNYIAAIEPLSKAVKENLSKSEKNRARYLLAQLYTLDNQTANASKSFNELLKGKNVPLEMEYFAKINLAKNAANGVGDKTQILNQLESLLKNSSYKKWQSTTLLAIAEILEGSSPEKAISYLEKSINQLDAKNVFEKASVYEKLGKLFFDNQLYKKALVAYDSAINLNANLQPPLKNINEILTRKDNLLILVSNFDIINHEDSLQKLSKLSKEEQLKIIKAEIERQEKLDKQKALDLNSNTTQVVTLSSGNKDWYFYNNALLQKGSNEFKTKWGNRTLSDNWRRSNKESGFTTENNSTAKENNDEETTDTKSNKQLIAQYLNYLYSTPAQFASSNKKIQEAYFNNGLAFYSRLANYPTSISTYDTLLKRYPNVDEKDKLYYSLYLNYKNLSDNNNVLKYKNQLSTEFPNSIYTNLVNETVANNKEKEINTFYESMYNLYQEQNYKSVLEELETKKTTISQNRLAAKFKLLEAKSLLGLNDIPNAVLILDSIIAKYPSSDEQIHA
ncbi:MAG: tetratricopeptide repeat protein, partial [Chitinophagaceae bacterium]|nr:tetratricopeptide repeat protein [Chitinophagaceae bacterium]